MEFPVQNYGLYNKLEPSRHSRNRPVPLLNLSSMRSPSKRFSNATSNESQSPYSQNFIRKLQGAYRDGRHIPEELLENIPRESVNQLLEYMLTDKMSSDDFGAYGKGQPSMMSYTDTDFSKLNYNYSMATAMTNSYYLRRPTFPVAPRSNIRDEIRQRRYNNISTYQRGIRSVELNSPVENVQEESEVQTAQQGLQEDYDQLMQKLKEADEMLEEARAKKELLEKVLRLSKRRKEVVSRVNTGFKEMKKLREELIEEIAMNSKLKFLVQTIYSKDSSSYARNLQSYESSLDQSALIELAEKESLGGFSPSDSELQTLNSLKESLLDAKKFETAIYSILSTSEPGDFLNLLIKYIRFIDEEASGSIRQELVEVKNKIKVQQFLQEELSKDKVHSEESVGNLTERLRQLSKPSVSS